MDNADFGLVGSSRFDDLAGRSAIVTGTSKGIGCAIARVLAGQGMKLVLTARSVGRGRAFADSLTEQGAETVFVPADLMKREDCRKVFDAAVDAFGRVDLLVNNAAANRSGTLLDTDEDLYAKVVEGNIRMVFVLSQLVAAHQAANGGGNIVHISSVGAAAHGHRGMCGYDASNGAIESLTRTMALELAEKNIRVNAVAPGAIAKDNPTDRQKAFYEKTDKLIPAGRHGTGEEIGWAVAFLASDIAAYITAQTLTVDGGLTAQISPPGMFV
ncbi:MAG: SDR family NAD(P)-dependent oxidoreductase [Phycisphaerae bacterium]